MPRDLGRGQNTHVEIDGQRFPLLAGSEVQRRPLVQFPNANKIGPNERPAKNAVLSSITFLANTQRGMGTYKHKVLDGIDTFRRGNLDTRHEGGVTAPPKVDSLTNCPVTFSADFPTRLDLLPQAGGIGFDLLIAYGSGQTGAATYSPSTGNWTSVGFGLRAAKMWSNYLVGIRDSNGDIYTRAAGVWTARDNADWSGLAVFANRLWSYNNTDDKLYSCIDPTLSIGGGTGAWAVQSEALTLVNGEAVLDLFVYRDRGGRPALFLLTNERIIGYDDGSGEFEDMQRLHEIGITFSSAGGSPYPVAHIWRRDNLLYATAGVSWGRAQRHVYQWTGNVNEVGPTKGGGFNAAQQFTKIEALSGNVHWLYAACSGDGVTRAGQVIAMNELGGWHTVYDNTAATKLCSVCAVGDNVYVLFINGAFAVIRDKDDPTVAHLRNASGETDTVGKEIYCGKTDCGLPNHEKLGASVYVACRKSDGQYGLPANNTLVVKYAVNGGAQVTLATLTSATTFPIELPLPGNDAENQDGVVFRDIELYCSLDPDAETGTIEELTLNFSRWEEPRWAYQMVVDLREESFRRFAASTDERRGLGEVRQALETLVATQTYHRVKYGSAEWEIDLKAADLVLAGRESPIDGSGLFPLTVRDVSAEV